MPNIRRLILSLAATVFFFSACGTVDMTSDPGAPANFAALRRVFVSDPARNDSLPAALAEEGLKFVLQPGRQYEFRITTPITKDKLGLFAYQGGRLQSRGTYAAVVSGGDEVFTLQSDLSSASYFAIRLLAADSTFAASRIAHVGYGSSALTESGTLAVHLFLVGRLANLPDVASENAFAESMLAELTATYAAYGVTITTSYELVNPNSAPVTLDFGPSFFPLPGTRLPNTAHLYLVDSISQTGSPPSAGTILGFAPREAKTMTNDPESRVILSARNDGPVALATTAAHELGHFIGLRHPSATSNDLQADDDQSNRDDGFVSTEFCADMALSKMGVATETPAIGPRGVPYCLRVASRSCPSTCDLTNLMFAYDCSNGTRSQRLLTAEQQVFVRRNLALLQSP